MAERMAPGTGEGWEAIREEVAEGRWERIVGGRKRWIVRWCEMGRGAVGSR